MILNFMEKIQKGALAKTILLLNDLILSVTDLMILKFARVTSMI